MVGVQLGTVLRHLRAAPTLDALSDGLLLEEFAGRRSEAAFEALVRRHGPMVLGVCRRLLRRAHDAEDAFQATFLVLFRRAHALDRRGPVAGWLHTVAYHVSLRAKAAADRRGRRERQLADVPDDEPPVEESLQDLRPVLDEELRRLPEECRTAAVLCYLQGKTNDEAARQLGLPPGTLKSRLARARRLLRDRLSRRGVTLSAGAVAAALGGQAAAAVPAALARAAVQAMRLLAAGGSAGAATALMEGVLTTMFITRLKAAATTLLLALGLLALGAGLLGRRAWAERHHEPAPQAGPAAEGKKPAANEKGEMTVTGRVLSPDGKPVAGAETAVVANLNRPTRDGTQADREERLGVTRTDADGRFTLRVRRTSSAGEYRVAVIAAGGGFGLGWQTIHPDAERPEATVRLAPAQALRGRLVDLQGQPAAGVKVYLAYVARKNSQEMDSIGFPGLREGFAPWPGPATTDAQGRFTLAGLVPDALVGLHVSGGRFARQTLQRIDTGAEGKAREASLILLPPQVVEGQVTDAGTGRPVPDVRVVVRGVDRKFGEPTFQHGEVTGRTDAQGRFRVSSFPGNTVDVYVIPPAGTAHLGVRKEVPWPKGAIRQTLDVALPGGVLVRGKVTEGGGKPVPGASIDFWPRSADNPHYRADVLAGSWAGTTTDADGTFQMAVLPGPGHLLAQGATPDFVQRAVYYDSASGDFTEAPGREAARQDRWHVSGLARLDLKPGAEAPKVEIALRRGVTVAVRVVGLDGRPVSRAKFVCQLPVASLGPAEFYPGDLRDGRLELTGCDPDLTYPLYLLDRDGGLGAVAEVSAKAARGGPVTVRLQPCGSAVVRFVDRQARPLAGYRPNAFGMAVLVRPAGGPGLKGPAAEPAVIRLMNLDRHHYGAPAADKQGRLTVPLLIPGATYRIEELGRREFTAEPGKALDLGQVTVPTGG